jgi:hypothetical protein
MERKLIISYSLSSGELTSFIQHLIRIHGSNAKVTDIFQVGKKDK